MDPVSVALPQDLRRIFVATLASMQRTVQNHRRPGPAPLPTETKTFGPDRFEVISRQFIKEIRFKTPKIWVAAVS